MTLAEAFRRLWAARKPRGLPTGFAEQCFPGRYKWAELGAYDAAEPENIRAVLEETKGSRVGDVVAALIFQVHCYQETVRAQEQAISNLTNATSREKL